MKEFEEILWIDKELGCKPLKKIRNIIKNNNGEHLYDAIYPEIVDNNKMKVAVKYLAEKKIEYLAKMSL